MDFQADHFGGMRIRHQEFSMRVEPRSDASSLVMRGGVFLFLCIVYEWEIMEQLILGRGGSAVWEYCHISGKRSR